MSTEQYARVNGTWPTDLPSLTFAEGRTAAKLLWRSYLKRSLPWQVTPTSGRRSDWIGLKDNQRVFRINPETGWRDLVHSLSHLIHRRLHQGKRPHDWSHASLERDMIEYVVNHGWLTGKLRRETKAKVKPDVKAVRYQRVVARITTWERKLRRAQNALKRLQRQRAYYEKAA